MYNPSKSSYFNPCIEYLFNDEIIEYDIHDAGLSIIKHFNLIDNDTIKKLESLGKIERHIAVGKIQRSNREFSNILNEKFTKMRENFISSNSLIDPNIISVKKDAIYVIGTCQHLKFGKVEFRKKNSYSSYIRFSENSNIEIYYSSDKMDVKGIGESGLNRHRLYLLDFLNDIIPQIELRNSSVKRFMKNFVDRYKRMELDEGYYLQFNNLSRDHDPVFNFQKLVVPLVQIITKELK